jgi:hypothetical protein
MVLVGSACSFSFTPQWQVNQRLILGMAAEPPEIIYDLNNPLAAAETNVSVAALVVDPSDGGTSVPYVWRGCSETLTDADPTIGDFDENSSRCVENSASELQPIAGGLLPQGSEPLATLGVAPGVLLSPLNIFTQVTSGMTGSSGGTAALASTFASNPNIPPTPIWLDAMIRVDDGSQPALYGIKRVVFSPDYPAGKQPNHTPHLTGVLFDYQLWEPDSPLAVTIGSCPDAQKVSVSNPNGPGSVTVCQHTITPAYDPDQDETYTVVTFTQNPDGSWQTLTLKEYLRFQWYIDQGSADNAFTEEDTNVGPNAYDPISMHWTEPAAPGNAIMHLWVVTTDGRGGESWDERQVQFTQ